MARKKNLGPATINLLRRVQQSFLAEPRRVNMREGLKPADEASGMLELPPCNTAHCIAGSAYIIKKRIPFNPLSCPRIAWLDIVDYLAEKTSLKGAMAGRLFYIRGLHSGLDYWPEVFGEAYKAAKTPLERATIAFGRIEHFIQTDGAE